MCCVLQCFSVTWITVNRGAPSPVGQLSPHRLHNTPYLLHFISNTHPTAYTIPHTYFTLYPTLTPPLRLYPIPTSLYIQHSPHLLDYTPYLLHFISNTHPTSYTIPHTYSRSYPTLTPLRLYPIPTSLYIQHWPHLLYHTPYLLHFISNTHPTS